MKQKYFFICVVILSFLLLSNLAFGQLGIRKGIKVGYNWATLSGDDLNGVESRKSIAGGGSLEFNLLGLLAFQVDVLYSPRGASIQNVGEKKLNYISIPIVLKQKFFPVGIHPYIMGGPEFNYLLSAKTDGTDIKDNTKSQDLAIVIGAGLEFSLLGNSAYIEGRYSHGLNDIGKQTQSDSKNRVSQIFFGFLF
jgi:hypothetical protein